MMGTTKMCEKAPKASNLGFTIVEAMVVLAVTGVLFLSITGLVKGKRENAEFRQAANSLKTELEQYMGEVQSGYYPSGVSFPCNAPSGLPVFSGSAAEQGGKTGCIFLGRVLQFNTSASTSEQTYTAYTIAGAKMTGGPSSAAPKNFDEANPAVVPAAYSRETKPLKYGLKVISIKNKDTGGLGGAIAVTPAFQANGSKVFGSTGSDIIAVNTPLGPIADGAMNTALSASYPSGSNPSAGIELCVQSATTNNKTAILTLGGTSGASTVLLTIKGDNTCD